MTFHSVGNGIINPTDSFFSEGVGQPPTRLFLTIINHIIEGSLEVKLPTIWTDEKQSRAEAREEED